MLKEYVRKLGVHEGILCVYIPKQVSEKFLKYGDYVKISPDPENKSIKLTKVEVI